MASHTLYFLFITRNFIKTNNFPPYSMNLFADEKIVYLGIVILFLLCVLYRYSKKAKQKRLQLLTSSELLPKLVPGWSTKQQVFKFGLLLLAFAFLFIGLARPQCGVEKRKSNPTGIDILIALDVSKSMLARDVRPNRLERVKLSISNLLDRVS